MPDALDPLLTESEVVIKVGDGGSSENFTAKAMINLDRSLGITHNYEEDELPDTETPTNPHDIMRYLRSIDYNVSGSGKVHAGDLDEFIDWAATGTIKNCQIHIGPVTDGRYIEGGFYCQFEVTGQVKRNAECSITLTPFNTGAVSVNDISA
jgi:hypothetical protein